MSPRGGVAWLLRPLLVSGLLLPLLACQSSRTGDVSVSSDAPVPAGTWIPLPEPVQPAPNMEFEFDNAGCIDLLEDGKSVLTTKLACDESAPSTGSEVNRPIQLLGTTQGGNLVLSVMPTPDVEVSGNIMRVTESGILLAFPDGDARLGIRYSGGQCWIVEGPNLARLECE